MSVWPGDKDAKNRRGNWNAIFNGALGIGDSCDALLVHCFDAHHPDDRLCRKILAGMECNRRPSGFGLPCNSDCCCCSHALDLAAYNRKPWPVATSVADFPPGAFFETLRVVDIVPDSEHAAGGNKSLVRGGSSMTTSRNPQLDMYDPKTLAVIAFAAVWTVLRADYPRDYAHDSELRIAIGREQALIT